MAYNEEIAQQIRLNFIRKNIDFSEKKMFSGICFMVDDKMCCGTHFDKKMNENLLLCRIGEDAYESSLEKNNCIPMDFTGKAMKGYVYVTENGFKNDEDLDYWLNRCLEFNPKAQKSKKKNK